jgi:phage gpG-like protein
MAENANSRLGDFFDDLNNLLTDLGIPHETKQEVAAVVKAEIDDNFRERGRWDGKTTGFFSTGDRRWVGLAESTKKQYAKKGYKPLEPTLYRSNGLRRSIEVTAMRGKKQIIRIVAGGSKFPYAAIHQFGGIIKHPGGTPYGFATEKAMEQGKISFMKKGSGFMVLGETKPHEIEIPARPYLNISTDGYDEVIDIVVDDIIDDLLAKISNQ